MGAFPFEFMPDSRTRYRNFCTIGARWLHWQVIALMLSEAAKPADSHKSHQQPSVLRSTT